jgi:hypothetical protein
MALWFGVTFPIATALLLAYVSVLVSRRHTSPDGELPLRMFSLWWACAGAVILLASMPTLLSVVGVSDVSLFTAIGYLNAAPLAFGLFALLYYLLYIYTGKRGAIWPLGIAYAIFFAFELYYFSQFGPRHIETSVFSVRAVPDARPPAPMRILFGAAVGLPILVALVAYASLYGRTRDPAARHRIAMVSGAFAIWFVPVLLALVLDWSDAAWFPLTYQVPGVVAAVLIVMAFRAPDAQGRSTP